MIMVEEDNIFFPDDSNESGCLELGTLDAAIEWCRKNVRERNAAVYYAFDEPHPGSAMVYLHMTGPMDADSQIGLDAMEIGIRPNRRYEHAVCCGSLDVQVCKWVYANTGQVAGDGPIDATYCPDCVFYY